MNLFDFVGQSSFDHSAHMVQSGHLEDADTLFRDLHWWRDAGSIKRSGFEVHFWKDDPKSGTRIQLTHHDGEAFSEPLRGAHVGLKVADPISAAEAVVLYAKDKGWQASKEPANPEETKWWVTLSILAFKLEFVPFDD